MRYAKKILITAILSMILAVLISGCSTESCEKPENYAIKDGIIQLDKEGMIPCELCEERNLQDKIVVLESKYCGACQIAIPKIQEAAEKVGAVVDFLDLSEQSDSDKMLQLGIIPYYTPTMAVGCQIYIGGKSTEEYEDIFKKFLKKN